MPEKLLLAPLSPAEVKLLEDHLKEWSTWRQSQDPDTTAQSWDEFINKSRRKAEWVAGLSAEIDDWEALHQIQLELQDRLAGYAHGGQTRQ
ncbi:hypothetical protein [Levilactobacillus bambusae]|uniref:Uncharacterized protein n=1 Tax=Levilactobacillus bambusae TaxID=2024736 RepID=A0A2V1MZG1_9LACO|nr:hypothetical protein [Levilactobacillus bambusae]PWF99877.1 hypothetical protein DCM90_07395 [Levilactobacillus bambusae]